MSDPDHKIDMPSETITERFMLSGGKVIDVTYESAPHDGLRRSAVLEAAAKLWGKDERKIIGSTVFKPMEHQPELGL